MSLKWRSNYQPEEINPENKPRQYVKNVQLSCKRHNFQTSRYTSNIIKNKDKIKKAYQKVDWACYSLDKKGITISVPNIIQELDASDLTDGNLQRKMLTIMVCNGKLIKIPIEINDGDKPKYRYEYSHNKATCEHLKNGVCKFDWDNKSSQHEFNFNS